MGFVTQQRKTVNADLKKEKDRKKRTLFLEGGMTVYLNTGPSVNR